MVSLFTGGGFFALTMTSERVERVEAALEFGGSMQLDLVVASGGLSVMAGIYLRLDDSGVTLGGYLRASGQVTVLRDHHHLGRLLHADQLPGVDRQGDRARPASPWGSRCCSSPSR